MRLPLLLLAATVVGFPVQAAESAWQELAPDTHLRLVAAEERTPDGRTFIALELDMPADTKTYWRVPGETGIPLSLDFSGSERIGANRVVWPMPEIEVLKGYTDFVHYGHVVIPIELEVTGSGPVTIELATLMGICSDICVPATASFSLPLDLSRPDAGHAIRINQAIALAPIAWENDDPPVSYPRFDAAAGTLTVDIDADRLDPETLVVDASEAGYVFGAPQKSPDGDRVSFAMNGGGKTGTLEGRSVTFVFMAGDGPYEVVGEVRSAAAD